MAKYPRITGSRKISQDYENINEMINLVEGDVDQLENRDAQLQSSINQTDARLDTIIGGSSPTKDPELTDIRTPDPSYTPKRPINVAGDITRDMQKQFSEQLADTTHELSVLGANKLNKSEFQVFVTQTDQQLTDLETVKADKNTVRNKSMPITKNDLDAELLGIIQDGSGGVPINVLSVPRASSVTPDSTNFIISSSNLFNKKDVIPDTALDRNTGLPVPNNTVVTSNYIQVRPSTAYSTERNMTFVEYDSSLNITKISGSSGTAPQTFTTTVNTMYIRIVVQYEILNTKQLNEGSVLLPYESWFEPYFENVAVKKLSKNSVEADNYKDYSINTRKLAFLKRSSNLFNKNDVLENIALDRVTGLEYENNTVVTSAYIPIKPMTQYSTERDFTYVEYDENLNILKVKGSENTYPLTFTTVADAAFIRFSVQYEILDTKQLNESATLLAYEPWYEYLDDRLIDPELIQPKETSLKVMPLKFDLSDYLPISVQACDGTGEDGLSEDSVAQDVYDLFDALMSKYPNYITRTMLGNDSSGTLPIYKYEFKPSDFDQPATHKRKRPKIIIVSGTHGRKIGYGDFQTSIFATYYFMKDICEHWKDNQMLEQLRWQFHFIIIPVANPWGINNKQRVNYNGVDLNRNYDYKWTQGTEGDYYGGTAPFSEVESQYVRSVVLANTDAIAFNDFHTRGDLVYSAQINLVVVPNPSKLYDATRYMIEHTSRSYKKQFPWLPDIDYYGFVTTGESAYAANWVEKVVGIPSVILEASTGVIGNPNLTSNSINSMKIATEELGVWVTATIQQYYK